MEAYARRLGADFVVLDWPGPDGWPMGAKFQIPRALDHYERIIYADADVLFRPGCLDLFALCAPNEMGVVDELPHHRQQPKFGLEASYQTFRRQMGFRDVAALPWYFNAGVMVVPRSHQKLLLPPEAPLAVAPKGVGRHCAEQHYVNARLLDSGMPYRLMDRRGNWQTWTDWNFDTAPPDAVLHWSGDGHDRQKRVRSIQATAAKHPVLPLPPETWAEVFEPFRGNRVALVRMPDGNVGDVLLEVAALKLFRHFGADAELLEAWNGGAMDAVCVAAGGNMGGRLNEAAAVLRRLIPSPVTVLPQSWERPEESPPGWTLWARERESLTHEPRARLAPDLSLCLTPADLGIDTLPEGKGRGVWLRQDGEGIWKDAPSLGDPAAACATPADYLKLAASFEEIISDRLHFCIAGLIAGRKVTILPNCYAKNRAVWEYSLAALGCQWADAPEGGRSP
jgi:hypothetical protein